LLEHFSPNPTHPLFIKKIPSWLGGNFPHKARTPISLQANSKSQFDLLEAFSVNNVDTNLLIFTLGDPHGPESGQS